MALLDFILNLVGLLLWFNWRAARFDPLSQFTPATLAGTLRRAEKSRLSRWHLPFGLLALLLLRVPIYILFGRQLNWVGSVDVGVISLFFKANAPSYIPMLLYSFYSFGVALTVFLLWILFLSILKSGASENDSLRQILRLHLGWFESSPPILKLLLPFIGVSLLWYAASWPLTYWEILPAPTTTWQRIQHALLVGAGSYLAWKPLIIGLLALYFVNCYVYFGRHPFWQHLNVLGKHLLAPLRFLPLRLGKIDFAPLVGIALVLLLAVVIEHGVALPGGKDENGRPKPRRFEIPGLIDLYRQTSG